MHLPASLHYFCVCPIEAHLVDFFAASDSIFTNFGININIQPITLDACLDLVRVENDRNFCIFLRMESANSCIKAISKLNELLESSPCSHKLAIIHEKREEIRRQIYFSLLSSLNMVLVFSTNGLLKTYGIQMDKHNPLIKSTLISTKIDPSPLEIANIQPIILDMTRCGVLEPVAYFVARDFGTCIAQILLPGSNSWTLSYLIQCDDAGRNDLDMVKICPVEQNSEENDKTIENGALTVLNDPKYPLCRAISVLIYDLQHLSPDLDVVTPLISTVSDALAFSRAEDATIFPDADGPIQVKKKYSKLFTEITNQLLKIEDHRKDQLAGIIKNLRRAVNFLNLDIKNLTSKLAPSINTKWLDAARRTSSPATRFSDETLKIRQKRIENEQNDGIVSMPFLEPYIEVKWPKTLPVKLDKYPHPILQEYAQDLMIHENNLSANKRFGV